MPPFITGNSPLTSSASLPADGNCSYPLADTWYGYVTPSPLRPSNYSACCDQCANTTNCNTFAFVSGPTCNLCYLYSGSLAAQPVNATTLGRFYAGASELGLRWVPQPPWTASRAALQAAAERVAPSCRYWITSGCTPCCFVALMPAPACCAVVKSSPTPSPPALPGPQLNLVSQPPPAPN